jgi:hypothetical protein
MLGLAPQGGKGSQRDSINLSRSCPGRARFASSPLNRVGLRSTSSAQWFTQLGACFYIEARTSKPWSGLMDEFRPRSSPGWKGEASELNDILSDPDVAQCSRFKANRTVPEALQAMGCNRVSRRGPDFVMISCCVLTMTIWTGANPTDSGGAGILSNHSGIPDYSRSRDIYQCPRLERVITNKSPIWFLAGFQRTWNRDPGQRVGLEKHQKLAPETNSKANNYQGGYKCPRFETGSELNPGGLPPPRPPGVGGCRPPNSPTKKPPWPGVRRRAHFRVAF